MTILILGLLMGAAVTMLRPDSWQAERDEAFSSLGQLLRLQDAQVLAAASPADAARLSTLMPEVAWVSGPPGEVPSSGPFEVAVTVSGSTVLGASRFGDAGCALLRREYSPGPGVAPATWALLRQAAVCVPSLAASLAPADGRGLSPSIPVLLD